MKRKNNKDVLAVEKSAVDEQLNGKLEDQSSVLYDSEMDMSYEFKSVLDELYADGMETTNVEYLNQDIQAKQEDLEQSQKEGINDPNRKAKNTPLYEYKKTLEAIDKTRLEIEKLNKEIGEIQIGKQNLESKLDELNQYKEGTLTAQEYDKNVKTVNNLFFSDVNGKSTPAAVDAETILNSLGASKDLADDLQFQGAFKELTYFLKKKEEKDKESTKYDRPSFILQGNPKQPTIDSEMAQREVDIGKFVNQIALLKLKAEKKNELTQKIGTLDGELREKEQKLKDFQNKLTQLEKNAEERLTGLLVSADDYTQALRAALTKVANDYSKSWETFGEGKRKNAFKQGFKNSLGSKKAYQNKELSEVEPQLYKLFATFINKKDVLEHQDSLFSFGYNASKKFNQEAFDVCIKDTKVLEQIFELKEAVEKIQNVQQNKPQDLDREQKQKVEKEQPLGLIDNNKANVSNAEVQVDMSDEQKVSRVEASGQGNVSNQGNVVSNKKGTKDQADGRGDDVRSKPQLSPQSAVLEKVVGTATQTEVVQAGGQGTQEQGQGRNQGGAQGQAGGGQSEGSANNIHQAGANTNALYAEQEGEESLVITQAMNLTPVQAARMAVKEVDNIQRYLERQDNALENAKFEQDALSWIQNAYEKREGVEKKKVPTLGEYASAKLKTDIENIEGALKGFYEKLNDLTLNKTRDQKVIEFEDSDKNRKELKQIVKRTLQMEVKGELGKDNNEAKEANLKAIEDLEQELAQKKRQRLWVKGVTNAGLDAMTRFKFEVKNGELVNVMNNKVSILESIKSAQSRFEDLTKQQVASKGLRGEINQLRTAGAKQEGEGKAKGASIIQIKDVNDAYNVMQQALVVQGFAESLNNKTLENKVPVINASLVAHMQGLLRNIDGLRAQSRPSIDFYEKIKSIQGNFLDNLKKGMRPEDMFNLTIEKQEVEALFKLESKIDAAKLNGNTSVTEAGLRALIGDKEYKQFDKLMLVIKNEIVKIEKNSAPDTKLEKLFAYLGQKIANIIDKIMGRQSPLRADARAGRKAERVTAAQKIIYDTVHGDGNNKGVKQILEGARVKEKERLQWEKSIKEGMKKCIKEEVLDKLEQGLQALENTANKVQVLGKLSYSQLLENAFEKIAKLGEYRIPERYTKNMSDHEKIETKSRNLVKGADFKDVFYKQMKEFKADKSVGEKFAGVALGGTVLSQDQIYKMVDKLKAALKETDSEHIPTKLDKFLDRVAKIVSYENEKEQKLANYKEGKGGKGTESTVIR